MKSWGNFYFENPVAALCREYGGGGAGKALLRKGHSFSLSASDFFIL